LPHEAAGVPETGNEKARKGWQAEAADQFMNLGDWKRSRPAPMLPVEGMPAAVAKVPGGTGTEGNA